MISIVRRTLRHCLTLALVLSLGACALFQGRDPVNISVIGIDPLPGQDLEMRMAIKLRVQNPNETPIEFNGVALNLEVNGQPLAAGVSDQRGSIGRFAEEVLVVPVSITAFSMLRQAVGLSRVQNLDGMPYVLRGKLASGAFGTMRFTDEGRLDLPKPAGGTW
ncbi:LEA type 2 family protein [Pseudomonas fontis]|uniref:LEA type 2 family protein n=1 Tax=Pseudomonas fontis TaxID=2942633 RepID=A0ABT5P0I8_9PSED|nr:LEA type 2 family protein [Pseudomonas fontis]MDD0977284.1 LEA type 2 family protein [Pseudomonas fontis]MDD0993844.1 LEA type 2 family protein [Pseudomonas fontis]